MIGGAVVTEILIQRIDPGPSGPVALPGSSAIRMPIDDLDEDPDPIDRAIYDDDDPPPRRGAP